MRNVNPTHLSLVDTTGRSPLLHATNSPFHGSTVSGDSGGGLSHPASPMKGKHNNAALIRNPAASGFREQEGGTFLRSENRYDTPSFNFM